MELQKFLTDSILARKIQVPLRVQLAKTHLSAEELATIELGTQLTSLNSPKMKDGTDVVCLESGGTTLAYGKIVKKGGKYYFKVTQEAQA